MRRLIFYAITLFLVTFESPTAATESIPPIQKISDEAVSYGMNIDHHAPDAGSWKPFSDFNSRELIGNDEFWLKIQIPPGNHKHPAVYTQGYFSGLQAVLGDGRVIYRRGKWTGDRSEDVPDTRSFFLRHLIRLPAGMQGTPSNADAAALYLSIPYRNPYDIGWFDAIYAGEMDDLAALADENERDLLKAHLPLLCVGAVLFFFGILLFIIFGLRFKERDYPFLSLGFFSFTAGILYLNLVPIYAAIDLSPRLWVTVEEVLTFLLPVGLLSFVAVIFPSSLAPLLRRLWKLQLVLTIGVLIWFLVSIVPSYVIFLGYVMALVCIAAILATIYKSTAKEKSMSVALKVALAGFLIFLFTAALDVFYYLGIVPFGGVYYGYGTVILILSFGYVLFDHYRTTMHNAQTYVLELETNKQKILKLEQATLLARFEALKSQINPHFLFNTLGTLMALIEENRAMAVDFVQELSRVYRYLLVTRDRRLVDVSEELAFIESYAYLVSRRYEASVSIRIDIGRRYLDRRLPPLSLQLLLENALKHNVISARKPLTVEIYVENDSRIVVRNNLQVKNVLETSHKIGLDNLRNQYHFFTQEKVMVASDDSYFTAKIPLLPPAQKPGNNMEQTTA